MASCIACIHNNNIRERTMIKMQWKGPHKCHCSSSSQQCTTNWCDMMRCSAFDLLLSPLLPLPHSLNELRTQLCAGKREENAIQSHGFPAIDIFVQSKVSNSLIRNMASDENLNFGCLNINVNDISRRISEHFVTHFSEESNWHCPVWHVVHTLSTNNKWSSFQLLTHILFLNGSHYDRMVERHFFFFNFNCNQICKHASAVRQNNLIWNRLLSIFVQNRIESLATTTKIHELHPITRCVYISIELKINSIKSFDNVTSCSQHAHCHNWCVTKMNRHKASKLWRQRNLR